MARNKRRKRQLKKLNKRQRDITLIANEPLLSSDPFLVDHNRLVEDRRTWHPDRARPALNAHSERHRLTLSTLQNKKPQQTINSRPKNLYTAITGVPAFSNEPILCVRRKTRREIIFALKKQKKGSGAKRRRRTAFTKIKC